MAGGNSEDISTPYPKGEDSLVLLQTKAFDMVASKTDHIVDAITLDFACHFEKAEFNADVVVINNAITINVEDDSGTAKEGIKNSTGVVAITAGASGVPKELTVDKTKKFNAGAILEFSYTSGATDSGTNAVIRIWVRPTF